MDIMNQKNKNFIEKKEEKKSEKKISWELIVIGWAGSLLIITAYTLNSLGNLPSNGVIYPFLNLMGSILIGIRVFVNKNWSNLFLEIFWAFIAIVSILKFFNLV